VNELGDGWLDGVALVLSPTLLARVLVPELFDVGIPFPFLGHEISCSLHEDSTHGCSRAHSFSALYGQLGNVKALVIVLAGLISYRAGRIPVLQAGVFRLSTGACIGNAASSCPRLTDVAISSCINRHDEASFADG